MEHKENSTKASPEQIRYANLLFNGCWGAIALLFLTYLLYVTGIIEAHVPMDKLPSYWSRSVQHYVEAADVPVGWGWVRLLGTGDFLNFLGIAMLAGLTIVGYLTLIPAYLRSKDLPFLTIVVLEILVLLMAASGLLGTGAH
jgi:hypothetical protein